MLYSTILATLSYVLILSIQQSSSAITTIAPNMISTDFPDKKCPVNETLYPCGPYPNVFTYERANTCNPLMFVMMVKNCTTLKYECDCIEGYKRESVTNYKCIKTSDCPPFSSGIPTIPVDH